ncbi:hypothetical protein [Thiohalocapsa marina]|uniref:hypothetical protein n=1 Tax=Thiohalocapsa marina TaxID=424902 RepID=UPI0036DCAF37
MFIMNNEHHSLELPMPNIKEQPSSPPPTPWFWIILIVGLALAFVLLILFPKSLAFEAIVNWLFFIVILRAMVAVLSGMFEQRERLPPRAHAVRPRGHSTRREPRHGTGQTADTSAAWLDSSDWLGPFNPDTGLSLDESPYVDHFDHSLMPTTFSDGRPWD